jgi:sugar (pentulose or hexulose) kinase
MVSVTSSGNELFAAFDAGTQSIRGALVDVEGNVLDVVRTPIEPYFSDRPGWAEQDPEYYWRMFCETSNQLRLSEHFRPDAIQAVAVTVQRGTYLNLDASGRPLRPAIVWLDERRADGSDWASPIQKLLLKAKGVFQTLDAFNRQCYANWIRQHQPEVWDRTHKFLLLSGFFTYKLTGRFVESLGNNFGYLPIDRGTFRWAEAKNVVSRLFPIEREKLPDLVPQAEVLGEISARASEETGLPEGLPVIASANDKGCEILGSGCLSSDIGCVSFGTISTINALVEEYVELEPFLSPYPAEMPGFSYTEIPVTRGFWMVRWVLEEFGWRERQLAEERGVTPESLFEEMAASVLPGCRGLVLQPHWSPFWATSGHDARGSIIGFTGEHTRAHLYRAILEGLAYGLRHGADITQEKLGPFERLRISGGGSQSDLAMQITADVFNLPAERPHTFETSALGAAIDAAVGTGHYPDFPTAVRRMTRIRDRFDPIPAHHELYSELYHRVYRQMNDRLRPLSAEIRDIIESAPAARGEGA